jgi:16S rRNA (cytosine1402-N4)-methyltransferase
MMQSLIPTATPSIGAARPHIPVLLEEVLESLRLERGGLVVDCTFGAGGYTEAVLSRYPNCDVIAIDRDPSAVQNGQPLVQQFPKRLTLIQGRFGDLNRLVSELGYSHIDAVMFDIGVSSMQLDQPQRGFSFRHDGPLDMRMSDQGMTAADLINTLDEEDIANLIYKFGEERRSRAIARAIVKRRQIAAFATTAQLAEVVLSVIPMRLNQIHPATRTFQALRIAVNDELGELERGLRAAEHMLKPSGRMAVVSFHSLEDRIVKSFMTERSNAAPSPSRHLPTSATSEPTLLNCTKKAIQPAEHEMAINPRARSAKLRVAERTAFSFPASSAKVRG